MKILWNNILNNQWLLAMIIGLTIYILGILFSTSFLLFLSQIFFMLTLILSFNNRKHEKHYNLFSSLTPFSFMVANGFEIFNILHKSVQPSYTFTSFMLWQIGNVFFYLKNLIDEKNNENG